MPETHQWPNGLIAALATVGALVVAAWGVEPLTAQEVAGDIEVRGSFGYEYRRQLREGLRGFGTLQYEETADLSGKVGDNSRVETTGGVSLDLSPRWRLEGGLGLYHDRFLESRDAWETRLWQAVTVDWPDSPEWSRRLARRFVVSHRLRLEERFNKIEDWEFSLRLRYRIGLSWAINKYSVEPGALYAPFSAEFYFPLGEDASGFLAQQNRLTAGLGYVFNKIWRVEVRYARQRVRDTVDADFRDTREFIEVRLKTALRIRDLIKSR